MTTYVTRLALAVPALVVLASAAAAQEAVDRRVAMDADGSIRVMNLVGSIRIIGWDKDSLAVTGTLPAGAGKLFYLAGGGRGAKLGVDLSEGAGPDQKSDLEIHVPARAKLWIKAASATIDVTSFRGGLDLYSVSGSITVKGAPAQVSAESMDGAIEFSGKTPFARLKTADGNITLTGTAEDVTATTVGGSISVQDEGFQRGRFESVTGDITFSGAIPPGASLTTESHSGKIVIAVPADVKADFYVANFQGAIVNQLSSSRPRPVRERGGQELSFQVGLGGADVSARNFKGDVVLKRR